jgi:hypothetical protein
LKPQSPDTSAHAERVQIRLLREAGPTRRFEMARALTTTAVELSRAALRKRHPALSEREVELKFVELCYGQELAQRLRSYLEGRNE